MAKYINELISKILSGETSRFEAITHINSLVDSETLEFFLEEFKEGYDNVAFDFIMSFSEDQIIEIFNFIESDFDFMFENKLSVVDIKAIKNYITIYFNISFDFNKETNRMEYDISKIDMSNIDITEVEKMLCESPRNSFAKICLLGDYFFGFNWIVMSKNIYDTYNDEQKKRFDIITIIYGKREEKAGRVKLLKSIYQFLLSKQYSISDKLKNFESDLSDTLGIDKILYLQKLGVIDFLRVQQPFSTSVNSLASVLSAITGEKSGTLQPMLNPMLSRKVDDKNNPLNSKKAVERVEKQLIKIGFNLNETN